MSSTTSTDSTSEAFPFELEPQTPTIGALVSGVDLTEDLSDEMIASLRTALIKWKVLFFRDQNLNDDQHIEFGKRFGELEVHPLTPTDQERPEILKLVHDKDHRGTENFWHSDVTWRPEPSMGSILRAIELPPAGGDTLWADMEQAYDQLFEPLKEKLEGLQAQHNFLRAFGHLFPKEEHEDILKKHPIQTHPVVRTHPESGRKSLYVNIAFTECIVGMERDESDKLLGLLWETAGRPENQVRLKWELGTVAFWDNRSSQHYAVSDYWPARRVMERVTIEGDRPS